MAPNIIRINKTKSNSTGIVKEVLSQLKDDSDNIIEFEKGTYYFYREGTLHAEFYPSNNASGEKDVVFPIIGLQNLTIDANGSEFIFCDRIFPFVIKDSSNIALKNVTIDFSFPRHCQGIVSLSDENGFALTIDKSVYSFNIANGNIEFHVGGDRLSTANRKLFIQDLSDQSVGVAYLFAGDCNADKNHLAAPAMMTDAFETANGIYFRFREGSFKKIYNKGDLLFIGNDENRENDVIFAEFSDKITIENTTIYRGAGMGIIAQVCRDISIDNLNICPRKDRNDILSITADGLHIVNCSGTLSVKNSKIEKCIDDAVNIHGVYSIADKVLSANEVLIKFFHPEQQGIIPYIKGDVVHLNSPETMNETGKALIVDVRYDKRRDNLVLKFKEDITGLICAGDIIENPDRMPEIVFENNTVTDCPHMLISSSKRTLIQHNRLQLKYTDIVVNDLFRYWYESGIVHEMQIRCNEFFGDGRHNIVISSERGGDNDHYHENIVIENNTFNNSEKNAIRASHVKHLLVQHNNYRIAGNT